MSDSEEDYMSASFSNVKEDIRPGLVKSNILKRKYEIEKKADAINKQQKTKPLHQIEEENRNVGLDTALTSDNKGFAMLQKMGYKPGMKLGPQKEKASTTGLSEPIKIQVKKDRGGLGREEQLRVKIREKENMKKKIKVWKENETARLTEEYRQRMRDKTMQKYLMSDLNKIRKVCERLDIDEGVDKPMRSWFWFSLQEEDDEYYEDDEDEYYEESMVNAEDQLYFINEYLRYKYFYCIWCGTRYEGESDLNENCPGDAKDDHE